MDTHSDEFNELRKLLALKRREQPPPRYFNEFSGRVIARLRTPELLPQPTWWQRLGLDLNFRPAMVCALGVLISGLFLFATVTTVQVDSPRMAGLQSMGLAPLEMDLVWNAAPTIASAHRPISSLDMPASTAPVFGAAPSSSPFSHFAVQASHVNWSFGNAQN